MKLETGEIINNRYRIDSLLGQSALSTVYMGIDTILERKIVIKQFHSEKFSNARIQREALILAKLDHSCVVKIFDVGIYNDEFYIITEYINGYSLRELNQVTSINLKQILKIVLDVSNGLQYLHEMQIIHRDLKPENILVAKDLTHAYISDFGISIKIDTENRITKIGEIIGTPGYLSPEQVSNMKLTFATDIYALGTIIYELLAGERPFNDPETYILFNKIATETAPSIQIHQPALPKTLVELINGMLSISPESRPSISSIINVLSENILNLKEEIFVSILNKRNDISRKTTVTINSIGSNVLQTIVPIEDSSQESKIFQFAATGFFENKKDRTDEFKNSIKFYRDHLDIEYKSLTKEARISFILWVISFGLGFLILVFAGIMLSFGKTIEGGISIISEVFIYFIQNMFRIREKTYRELAEAKNRHIELGNYWNLASQTIEAIDDDHEKQAQLKKLTNHILNLMTNFNNN
jgi:serine/threonine protein kinase